MYFPGGSVQAQSSTPPGQQYLLVTHLISSHRPLSTGPSDLGASYWACPAGDTAHVIDQGSTHRSPQPSSRPTNAIPLVSQECHHRVPVRYTDSRVLTANKCHSGKAGLV